jgi:hypothetical protein
LSAALLVLNWSGAVSEILVYKGLEERQNKEAREKEERKKGRKEERKKGRKEAKKEGTGKEE